MPKVVLLVAVTLVMLAACSSTPEASPPESAGGLSGATSTATIENRYWTLTRIGDQPVTVSEGQREPNLVLHSENQRVTGFDGCNQFTGGYSLSGTKLTFSEMASTMMACVNGVEQERAFHGALGKVAGWRLEGDILKLLDATGASLAQFESSPTP